MSIQTIMRIETVNNCIIELMQIGEEYRIDSRHVAPNLDIEHQTFLETLQKYQTQLEHFGLLRFETDAVKTATSRGTKYTKYALLNRNQILFAITLSRNTEQVVEWKVAIIDALDQLEKQLALHTSGQRSKPALATATRKPKRPAATEEEKRSKLTERVLVFLQQQKEPVSRRIIMKYATRSGVPDTQAILDELMVLGQVTRTKVAGSKVEWFYRASERPETSDKDDSLPQA